MTVLFVSSIDPFKSFMQISLCKLNLMLPNMHAAAQQHLLEAVKIEIKVCLTCLTCWSEDSHSGPQYLNF